MRVLICNDDGIDAPGLGLLERVASRLSAEIDVVAPDGKRTAAGASLTIGRPLVLRRLGARRHSCSGTPADCVVAAMTWLFRDGPRPDLVLSGINDGRNVGEDLAYSGTLGIAREASFWGIPAIGLSRVKHPAESEADEAFLAALLAGLWDRRAEWSAEGHWLSINLPSRLPAGIRQPKIGRDKIARTAELVAEEADTTTIVVPRGRQHASTEGDENSLIDAGYVCVNRLNWFGGTPLDTGLLSGLEAATRATG